MDYSIFVIVIQLVFLEGILSIDNAAVLGAMVAPLPADKKIPWPPSLQKLGEWMHPLLGYQRSAALKVGLLGAYFGRGLMLLLASFLIDNLWIRIVGAVYLIRLAFNELGDSTPDAETEKERQNAVRALSFWHVVLTVELMDLVFSIDNVVAAVAISDELWVVLLGVAIGILTMRFAAGVFSYAVEREPILKEAAYILILNIGIQLILEEIWKIEISDWLRFSISIFIIVACLAYAHSRILQKTKFILTWFSKGMGILNDFVDWAFYPITALIEKIFQSKLEDK
ncbi:MAG: DUF475 domain-containing protein [Anaerolineales bacterium]|nr:DUF475 domain-containing protein [Anaerolineales bacterium]